MTGLRWIDGRDPVSGRPLRVSIEAGHISAIDTGPDNETAYLSPGLIDLQVNGYAGYDLNSGRLTAETVAALTHCLLRRGITTFLPTLITASEISIIEGLQAIALARRSDPAVADAIPFVHVEGPWIAPEEGPRGAHPAEHVRAPNLDEVARWQSASGSLVGKVTLSPHFPQSAEIIRALASQGIHVAIGHTNATHEQISTAVDAGARLSTHLGNGIAAVLARHPNVIWSQLAEDRLTAGLIADGHHLSPETFKAMLRAKGLERTILVSDSAAPAGLPPGIYDQPIGNRVELTPDGRLGIVGTPYLAGAGKCLSECIPKAMEMAGITLAQALQLATAQPGAFVGGRSRLVVGARADLIRFHWEPGDKALTVDTVILTGRKFDR
jgi:N-acetylglucosamine-6-phosphate deacetylase